MGFRLDRVSRAQYLDDRQAYTIIVEDEGLYIIHTGDDDAMMKFAGSIGKLPLPELATAEHSAFVPYEAVVSVVARARPDEYAMFMKTTQGNFSFVFGHSAADDVQRLLETITANQD